MRVPVEIQIEMSELSEAMALAGQGSIDDVVNLCIKEVVHSAHGIGFGSVSSHLSYANELAWSSKSELLISKMDMQSYLRSEVRHDPLLLEKYAPNRTHLLPTRVKSAFRRIAATDVPCTPEIAVAQYRRIRLDMIWCSARLESIPYTRRSAERLFDRGPYPSDPETSFLLLHRHAFEYMCWGDDGLKLEIDTVRQIQIYLARGFPLTGPSIANQKISMVVPSKWEEGHVTEPGKLLEQVVKKSAAIKDPFEASFFLWLHLSYLLCIENGIERTARLAMNIPLLRSGNLPISFYEVNQGDYVMALFAYFKYGDASLAADLFAWAYRESLQRYRGFTLSAVPRDE